MNESKIAEINMLVRKNSKTELVRMCIEKELSFSGTKHDMAVRLIGGLRPEKEVQPLDISRAKKIVIHRDAQGRWVFEGLIFHERSKSVVGRLDEKGLVCPLRRHDIEMCRRYKFHYEMPEALDERPWDVAGRHADIISSDDEEEEEPVMMETEDPHPL